MIENFMNPAAFEITGIVVNFLPAAGGIGRTARHAELGIIASPSDRLEQGPRKE